MSARITLSPSRYGDVLAAMMGLAAPYEHSTLEPALITLVKVRVSQINGFQLRLVPEPSVLTLLALWLPLAAFGRRR